MMQQGGVFSPERSRGPIMTLVLRYPWVAAFLVGIAFLTAIRPLMRHIPEPPPRLFPLPAYDLRDQDGLAFDDRAMRGRVWVAGFVFTRCTTVCPRVTEAMRELSERYARDSVDVAVVGISVDPTYDTPEVLARYAADRNLPASLVRFVTGSEAAVENLVTAGFKQAFAKAPASVDGATFDLAHSTRLALVDQEGIVRGFYESNEVGLDEVFHRAQHVLGESPRR